jgi:DNA-directed RNA polymerase specialized sigma24 family protein
LKLATGYKAWDQVFDTLPHSLARPIYLRYAQQWAIKDIVDELRCSRATVYRQIKRGIEILRETGSSPV